MKKIFVNIKELVLQKNVLKSLTIKNFKARYVNSVIGIMWAVITPLLMAIVINIIFTKILRVEMKNFTLFVLSGFFPWMFFSRSLSEATNSIVENVNLLNQFRFKRETIPLSVVLSNFLSFLLGFLFILPLFIIFNYKIILYIWILPIVLLFFLLFTVGICLLLSALNVLTRDVKHLVEVFLLFWFWMTPVFYSVKMVPSSYRFISYLNPLTYFIIIFRDVLYNGKIPDWNILVTGIILSFVMLFFGYIVFLKLSSKFLKKI